MTLRQQKAFANIILHCSLSLSITKMHKRVAYWRLIDFVSISDRKYDQQLKDTVIEEVIIGERSAAQVARDHELPESAVYSWIRAHKEKNSLAVLQYKNETPEQEI